ncbi:MAG: hypothetical protein RL065_1252 [Bacteroidota bacterium]
MQKSNINALLVFGGLVIFAYLIWLFYYNVSPSYNWDENYKKDSNEPYGLSVFHELLKESRGDKDFVLMDTSLHELKQLVKSKSTNMNYVLAGNSAQGFDDSSATLLKQFIENSNNAFLILKSIPNSLNDKFKIGKFRTSYWVENVTPERDTSYYDSIGNKIETTIAQVTGIDTSYNCAFRPDLKDTIQDSFVIVNKDTLQRFEIHKEYYFSNFNYSVNAHEAQLNYASVDLKEMKNWSYDYFSNNNFIEYQWNYFETANFTDSLKYDSLGVLNDRYCNFIRLKVGKGYLYLQSIPMAFTNYQLTEERKFDYLNKFCSYFNTGKIIWDESSLHEKKTNHQNNTPHSTPLQYIFSNKSLKWAWYTALIGVLLYLIFHIKRQLPAISIRLPKQNTSLEYVKNISFLYFSKKSHQNIALKKWKLFSSFLFQRYGEMLDNMDDSWIERLSQKSGVDKNAIAQLVATSNKNFLVASYDAKDLIEFHQHLQYFYNNCK